MSNLILPQGQQNTTLENNLSVLFNRYPHERERLESILRKPAPIYDLPTIALPAVPSQPPVRILLLMGIANPMMLAAILNDPTIQVECFKLFIFEQDPQFLAFCFQNADLTQIIAYPKTEWFLCHTTDSVKGALFRALKPEGVTSMMLSVQALSVGSHEDESINAYYEEVHNVYDETAKHVLHNHGNLNDSLLGIEVTLRNKDFLLSNPGVSDLKDQYKGANALLVGAGPSLDQSLETIKKYNDRFVVIAADAALKPLLNAGIRVDYVTSIERLNAYQKPFFENLGAVSADLVAFPVVHPDVLKMYPGTVRIAYRNYSFFAYFEKAYPKGILRCGGSTSHLGLRLADYMGCKRVFLIGQDSAYQEKDGLYRSHCSGTGHAEWGEYVPLEEFSKSRRHLPPIKALNNLGEEVFTNITYYQWIKEYSEELAYIGQHLLIKNCSPIGLQIDGVDFQPLEEAAQKLDVSYYEKPEPPKVTYNRSWDNKDLLKNFEGWATAAEDCIKECDELLKLDQIPQDRFASLNYVYNFRFIIDDVFVAFVIQCCAFRFFDLENRWWSLRINEGDEQQKVAIYKERFLLFSEVLQRLITMFKEEGE